jgi:AcrR family transcriptional regulator
LVKTGFGKYLIGRVAVEILGIDISRPLVIQSAMATLSRRQRELVERGNLFLAIARDLLIEGGYHGLTMARVALGAGYSKGTIYQHFSCKEEMIITLAAESVEKQQELVERAAMFRGRPRERMLAIGEATELFALLHADDARIFHVMSGEAIIQKASDKSVWRMRAAANRTVSIMNGILRDAVAQGDLVFDQERRAEDLVYHMWLLGDAGKASASSWMPPSEMGVSNPFTSIIRSTQILGDAYGWKPLSTEWDYEETRARIHREVFPAEMRRMHGIHASAPAPGSLTQEKESEGRSTAADIK